MYMDASSQLQEIRFAPALASEAWQPSARLYPGVASSAGSGGTKWRSEAVLVNPGTVAQTATLDLIPRDAATVAKSATRTVQAGQLLRIADLYADLGVASGAGMLRVSGEPLTWVRTFNQGVTGTFGQDVPPASLADAFAASDRRPLPGHHPGRPDEGVPVQPPARQPRVSADHLHPHRRREVDHEDRGGRDVHPDRQGRHLPAASGRPRRAGGARHRALGGDGIRPWTPVPAIPPPSAGCCLPHATVVLFPGVASLAGSLSTQWRSEAVLYNAGTAAKTVLLEILPKDGSSVAASTSLQLQPKEVRRVADLYAELHAASGSGLLRVTGDVLAWVRTYNQGASATFGQDVPPVLPAGGTEAGSEVLFPISKPRDSKKEFRSNLILYNHGTAKLTCTVTAGTKSKTTDVPAGAYAQVNDVGTWLGVAGGVDDDHREGERPLVRHRLDHRPLHRRPDDGDRHLHVMAAASI